MYVELLSLLTAICFGFSSILTPMLAAAAYGASSVFRKLGVDLIPHAHFGAMIGAATSLASFSI